MQHCNALSPWTYPRQWLRHIDEKSNLKSKDTVGLSKICINFAFLYNQPSSWFIWKKHSHLNTLVIDFAVKDMCVEEGSHRIIGWVIPGLLALLPKFWPPIMFWVFLREYWGGYIVGNKRSQLRFSNVLLLDPLECLWSASQWLIIRVCAPLYGPLSIAE